MDIFRGPDQETILFLCCSTDYCERFTQQLREEMHHNQVHNVADARHLVGEIERHTPRGGRALVVLDGQSEAAWEGYDALRASHLRRVPVLAICDLSDEDEAYERGVNAVVSREHWQQNTGRVAKHVMHFWLRLARLPATSERLLF